MIKIGVNSVLGIEDYDADIMGKSTMEAFAIDITKGLMTFGLSQLLGVNPLSDETASAMVKAISQGIMTTWECVCQIFGGTN